MTTKYEELVVIVKY